MNTQTDEVAEAAAALTIADFRYLEEHGMLAEQSPASENSAHTQEAASQEQATEKPEPEEEPDSDDKDRKRRKVSHAWPDVGTVLEADYKGTHYEAEVVEMPRLKSGKALKILTGPAKGKVCTSMSRAMLDATEKQREEQGLGRSGVSNGWEFWKRKEDDDEADNS